MEGTSLDELIDIKISKHIQTENIVNSCVQKYHADKTIDLANKKDFFNKCVDSKINIYNWINKNKK